MLTWIREPCVFLFVLHVKICKKVCDAHEYTTHAFFVRFERLT